MNRPNPAEARLFPRRFTEARLRFRRRHGEGLPRPEAAAFPDFCGSADHQTARSDENCACGTDTAIKYGNDPADEEMGLAESLGNGSAKRLLRRRSEPGTGLSTQADPSGSIA